MPGEYEKTRDEMIAVGVKYHSIKIDISEKEYKRIIISQEPDDLMYIDLAGFRKLYCLPNEAVSKDFQNRYGTDMCWQRYLIKASMVMEFVFLFALMILSILAFKWLAILTIPLLLIVHFSMRGRASMGKQSISLSIIAVVLLAILSYVLINKLLWISIFILLLGFPYLMCKLMYYLTSVFTFQKLHTSYNFFKDYFMQPGVLSLSMVWTKREDKKRIQELKNAGIF